MSYVDETWIFGTTFLQAFFTEFDMDLMRIGFGKKTLKDIYKSEQVNIIFFIWLSKDLVSSFRSRIRNFLLFVPWLGYYLNRF